MKVELNKKMICEIYVQEKELTDIKKLPAKKNWWRGDDWEEGFYKQGQYGFHAQVPPKVIKGWCEVLPNGDVYKKANITIVTANGTKHYRVYETNEEMHSDVTMLKIEGWAIL